MPSASIKFVQGTNVGTAGVALLADLGQGTTVVASNGNDAGVVRWRWTMISVPGGSAVPIGVISDGAFPTATFNWDITGCYLMELIATDISGNQAIARLAFGVLETSGRLIPSFDCEAAALNFGGQLRGWAKYMDEHLRAIANPTPPPSVLISGTSIDWSSGNAFYKTLAAGLTTFTFANVADGQTIVVRLTSNAGGSTVAWPAGIKWAGGTPPTQTTPSGRDTYTFVSMNGTIDGSVVQALA